MADRREDIREMFAPLFEKARNQGLWFFCSYQSLWWSPDELESAHDNNKFLWDSGNFMLRHPAELEEQLASDVREAIEKLECFRKRVAS